MNLPLIKYTMHEEEGIANYSNMQENKSNDANNQLQIHVLWQY
jgi:hypothetical protein